MQPPVQAPQPQQRTGRSLASLSSTFSAQTFCAPTTSSEALALAYVLRHMRPEDLHARLLHSVTHTSTLLCSPDTFENIFHAFEELGVGPTARARAAVEGVEADTERHCARCHNTYLERDNGLDECRIAHDMAVQVAEKDERGNLTGRIQHYYPCCNTCLPSHVTLEQTTRGIDPKDGREKGGKWCFTGRHTTQRGVVQYNDTNVPECWVRRCEGAVPAFHEQVQDWRNGNAVGQRVVTAQGGPMPRVKGEWMEDAEADLLL